MDRKQFIGYSVSAMAGAAIPRMDSSNTEKDQYVFKKEGYREMVREAIKYKKIDAHNHIYNPENVNDIIKSCNRLGVTWTAVSNITGRRPQTIEKANNVILNAIKKYPNRFIGQCFINPGYTRHALAEIERCIDNGMVMLGELYDDYKINDPVYYPVIEKCIDLNIPLLVHAAPLLGNWRKGYPVDDTPTTSIAEDLVDIANRYPEAIFIHGHVGGGGDWEYTIKVLREAPGIYLDTSGSVSDARIIDMAVEQLGVGRLLFATDTNYETGVGKIMCAKLTEKERKKIFFDNFNNILRKAGNNVD